MTPDATARAADLLLEARRSRRTLAALPQDCAPRDLDEAYAVQHAFAERSRREVVGYKVGATSEAAQRALGLEAPFWGRVLASGLLASPAGLAAEDFPIGVMEPEFAFRLGAALDRAQAPFDEAAVAAVVTAVHPVVELVASAFGAAWKGAGGLSIVADNGVHGALVLGPAWRDWQNLDLGAHAVRLAVNGEPVSQGVGANAMGGPLRSLAWLANDLAGRGIALKTGDVVTTGVVTDPVALEAGDQALADFGPLGEVRLAFAA